MTIIFPFKSLRPKIPSTVSPRMARKSITGTIWGEYCLPFIETLTPEKISVVFLASFPAPRTIALPILDPAFRKPGTVQIYIGGTSIENQPCRLTVHFCIQIDVIENKLKVMLLGVEKGTKKQH